VGWPAHGIAGAMLGAHQLAMQKWAHMASAPIPVGVSMSGKHSHSHSIVGWVEVSGRCAGTLGVWEAVWETWVGACETCLLCLLCFLPCLRGSHTDSTGMTPNAQRRNKHNCTRLTRAMRTEPLEEWSALTLRASRRLPRRCRAAILHQIAVAGIVKSDTSLQRVRYTHVRFPPVAHSAPASATSSTLKLMCATRRCADAHARARAHEQDKILTLLAKRH
jgi:hypothetical protein